MTTRPEVEGDPQTSLERSMIELAGGNPDDPIEAAETLETIADLIEAHGIWRRSL